MKEGKFLKISADTLRIILLIIGSVLSTSVLVLAILATLQIQQKNFEVTSYYLFTIFLLLGASRFITFITNRSKINLIRFISLLVFNITLGLIILFAKNQPYLYSLCGGLYCVSIIVSRVFKLILKHNVRSIVFNTIIILFAGFLAVAFFIPTDSISAVLFLIAAIVTATTFIEVVGGVSNRLKFRTLFKIILRTYALEVILGLLTLIVAFALILMIYEESITNIGDGLWYCFAVVTTIGFGDITAVTPVGRILTVILGIYGIIVVAVITSIIVNFYNETAGKKDIQEFKEIKKEENDIHKTL